MTKRALLSYLFFGILFSSFALAGGYTYPAARKDTAVIDNFHGTMVADPYRWMENQDTPEIKNWIDGENTLTRGFIDAYPNREKIKSRLTELLNYTRYSVPERDGKRYFYSRNDGLQNQAVLYMQDMTTGDSSMVLDPNMLSADGTWALDAQAFSDDGSLLAYGISKSGSDQQEIHVRNIDKKSDYPEALQWCKFANIAWKKDNSGFYYNRYPDPSTVAKGEESFNNKVYWHALGTPQSQDPVIFEDPKEKELAFAPIVTDDGKYLLLYVRRGTDPVNAIYYREVSSSGQFVHLLNADARWDLIDNVGATFYFNTNLNAPHSKVVAIDINHPEPAHWKEILPEQSDALSFAGMIGHSLVVSYLHDAYSTLKICRTEDGALIRQIALPTIGSIGGISGHNADSLMFFSFTSFLFPTSVFKYDLSKDKLTTFRSPIIKFDPSAYETRQEFAQSKDGTKIPVFITMKKGLPLDGSNPALLYGYGGFNISMTPSFSSSRLVWLEHGGIYALACMRGGSEYGEAWHEGGMLGKKQNVFDDFIAAAHHLIDQKYTSTPKLAIQGGSNGGLLVSACEMQQPQLYGAVICQVPVADMLRYHKWTIGRFWTGEYGNAEE
ncbi:MAG TPA: prolyl oligopeptidase family serine peptidase, partial [Bacteroidota bacterium]|nr:prolyl oligopeptidase family serine peptidase [Bacteroidota bacterium]